MRDTLGDSTEQTGKPEGAGERYSPEMRGEIEIEHVHRYAVALALAHGKWVVDIACGEGYGSSLLSQVAAQVIGVDIAEDAIAHARATYAHANLQFRVGSCASIPVADGSIDLVVSFETIEHHDQHEAMMQEIRRILRADGVLVISSPEKHEYSDVPGYHNPFHAKELYRGEFEGLLTHWFANVLLYGQRVVAGSCIAPLDRAQPSRFVTFAGSALRVEATPGVRAPRYLLALASNGPLPELPVGLFGGGAFLWELDHRSKLRAIEQERDQRLGALSARLDQEAQRADGLSARLHQEAQRADGLSARLHQEAQRADASDAARADRDRRIRDLSAVLSRQTRRADETEEEIRRMKATWSWFLTKPLRLIKSWYRKPPHLPPFRSLAFRASRSVYRSLPLSTRGKRRLKGIVFTLGAPVLRATVSYRAWLELEAMPAQRIRLPGPGQSIEPGAAEPYEQAYRAYAGSASSRTASDHVALDDSGVSLGGSSVKVIAFYLPQFHPVPVNDAAWGRGFTDWTNVSKAVPQFLGHYQPHLPGELGFYDLRVPEVQRRQVELARLYGLHGFCFHFYWFGGMQVLERPLRQFHADKSLDFPYCICWANENWTRRWDGQDQEILLAQVHSPEEDLAFLEAISPFLTDPRYIRVDGRPLLIVYRAQLLPNAAATAARWRERCRQMGLPEPYLVAAQTFGLHDPTPLGFDGAVEFPPHNTLARDISDEVTLLNGEFRGHVYDYRALVASKVASYKGEAFPVFRSVCPGWDNEARRPGAGHVFFGSDPASYSRWLASACAVVAQHPNPDMRMVFVNAWNEWAEGAHLEPDRRYGYAHLAATKRVVERFACDSDLARIGVVVHLHYDDIWPEIRRCLYNIPEPFDLHVTIPPSLADETRHQLLRDFPRVNVLECENRGRDILPFLKALQRIGLSRYHLICKVHSKKTVHRTNGGEWREQALRSLLGSPEAVDRILKMFDENPELAMIGPSGTILQSSYYWGVREHAVSNRRYVRALAARMGINGATDHFHFAAGSMFWLRPSAVSGLLDLRLSDEEFEAEAGQHDGTLAHAMERFLGLLVTSKGFWLADTTGTRFDRVISTGRPRNAAAVRSPFAHPTFDGEPL